MAIVGVLVFQTKLKWSPQARSLSCEEAYPHLLVLCAVDGRARAGWMSVWLAQWPRQLHHNQPLPRNPRNLKGIHSQLHDRAKEWWQKNGWGFHEQGIMCWMYSSTRPHHTENCNHRSALLFPSQMICWQREREREWVDASTRKTEENFRYKSQGE